MIAIAISEGLGLAAKNQLENDEVLENHNSRAIRNLQAAAHWLDAGCERMDTLLAQGNPDHLTVDESLEVSAAIHKAEKAIAKMKAQIVKVSEAAIAKKQESLR